MAVISVNNKWRFFCSNHHS